MSARNRQPVHKKPLVSRRSLIYLVVMVLLLYLVVPQIGAFADSVHQLRSVRAGWLLIGVGWLAASFLLSALLYYVLSLQRLPYGRTVLVQMAGLFVNRLLPAGSGAMSVSYLYMRWRGFSRGRAVAIVAVNNLLGFVGNALLLGLAVLLFPAVWQDLRVPAINARQVVLVAGAVMVVGLVILSVRRVRRPLVRLVGEAARALGRYRRQPGIILAGLGVSMGLTLSYAACLLASAAAAGVALSLPQALFVLTASVAVATIVPTPGGLGGAEAGVVAALLAVSHLSAGRALLVALLYRAITFWLALLVGAVAFVVVERRGFVPLHH